MPSPPRRVARALAGILLAGLFAGLLVACGHEDDRSGITRKPTDPAQYVALGDSYTSAPGIPHIVEEGCFRSNRNYPSLVADELNLTLDDVSCGGAATTALVGVQETTTGPKPAQFDALTEDTELVTLGIGGNDEGLFGVLIAKCLELGQQQSTGSPCHDYMNADGQDKVLTTIKLIQERITSALVGIQDRAPDAEVVLVGYPQLVPDRIRCATLPLSTGDYSYIRQVMSVLGQSTERAAKTAGVHYVDLLAASKGHDVCAGADAWIQGMLPEPNRPGVSMHPYAEEQEAVAELVVDALDK